MKEAPRSVDEAPDVASDFVSNHARRVGPCIRAAHLDDAAFVDADREATGIRTIEGADTRAFLGGHGSSLLLRRYRGSDRQFFGLGVAASVLEPAVLEPNPRLFEAIEPACLLSGWGQFLD